jgi:hypothetical protein
VSDQLARAALTDALTVVARQLATAAEAVDQAQHGPLNEAAAVLDLAAEAIRTAWDVVAYLAARVPQ